MFNVLILGGEEIGDYDKFRTKCLNILQNQRRSEIMIREISDDAYIDVFAQTFGLAVSFYPCEWETYGKDAFKKRAEEVLTDCNGVINFSKKKDAKIIAKIAKERGIKVRTIT